MTGDERMRRDERIRELEKLGRKLRTPEQQDELGRLTYNRDQEWRRLPQAIAAARAKARDLENYARQVGLPL